MINRLKVLLAFSLFAIAVQAQDNVQRIAHQAFLLQNNKLWERAIDITKKSSDSKSIDKSLQLLHLYYGYTAQLLGKKQYQRAEEIIQQAEIEIEKILTKDQNNALALNYKGVFLSYKIPFNKLKVLFLGKESVSLINKALKLSPSSPQVLFDKGNSLYYVPIMMGGSKKSALNYFQKAIQQLEQQKQTQHNWIYLQLLFQQAHCLELLGDTKQAAVIYEKCLQIEPEFKTAEEYYKKLTAKQK